MTLWHAVVPIKPIAERKTRLRGHFSPDEIARMTVLDVVARSEVIGTVTLLAAERPAGWDGDWFGDSGGGLNTVLGDLARTAPERLVILHADLPALQAEDVTALVAAAGEDSALSPDMRGIGTNAIALRNARGFAFAFGANSFQHHCAALPGSRIVRRPGLALDIDLPEDVAEAIRMGYLPPGQPAGD